MKLKKERQQIKDLNELDGVKREENDDLGISSDDEAKK